MPLVGSAFLRYFIEVIVPLPIESRLLLEEPQSQNPGGISLIAVWFAPEAIIAPESGNSTGCTQTSTRHNAYVFLPD